MLAFYIMQIVEFLDYTNDNIKIINGSNIEHPYQCFFHILLKNIQ